MINQWQNTANITCEYDLEILCMLDGEAVMTHEKINWDNHAAFFLLLLSLVVSFRLIAYAILWFNGRKDPLKLEFFFGKVKSRVMTQKI
jgi:hypothetical protein